MSDTVSVKEAASLMCVHQQTVLDTIASGELPAGKIGRAYVMMRRDVLALIERRIAADTARRAGITRAGRANRSHASSRSVQAS